MFKNTLPDLVIAPVAIGSAFAGLKFIEFLGTLLIYAVIVL